MDLLVTTVYHPTLDVTVMAQQYAASLGATLVERKRQSYDTLRAAYQVEYILAATKTGPVLYTPEGTLFFHLNMAQLRIENLLRGQPDYMLEAMALEAGMSVLDTTLGLGADAIVASYVAGPQGKVTGVESSPVIALITAEGLKNFNNDNPAIVEALRRVSVVQANHEEYFQHMADASYDIVYFDPMFRHPILAASSLLPMRGQVNNDAVSPQALAEACRIARRRVVVKEAHNSPEFERLGITTRIGGKYSSIQYGIIRVS